MANIVLNSQCNLNCSYCFAKDYIKNGNENFSLTNFEKVINFIKTEKNERIGLVGGEPFLHPNFDEMLNILERDKDINNVIIFTNGTFIKKYINKLNHNKFNLLINCNYPEDIGEKYSIVKENLKLLKEADIKNITLGINLYSELKNYDFIFDLLKIINSHELRYSFSFSKEKKKSVKNILVLYRKLKPFWKKFIEECNQREIIAVCDCNPMPDCLLDDYDRNMAIKTLLLAKKYNTNYILSAAKPCRPLIDIFPDLNAVRSFCYSIEGKVPISKFDNLSMLREYFYNEIDIYSELTFLDEHCIKCFKRLTGKCRICPIFKTNKIHKLKHTIAKCNFN